jgi:AcrR family transcriptional regulator
MASRKQRAPRRYRAPLREEGALRTRRLITKAAKETFEKQGWSGATMSAIASRAGVSQSSVEALFKTKPVLLQAAVDYAIRGDIDPTPIRGREITTDIEAAPDATSMLELHARHLRRVHSRSAHLAFVVEHAAKSDKGVATLWRRMNANRRDGVEWAARTLLAKPDTKHLRTAHVETTFWVALDWGNYRLLTDHAECAASRG